MSAEFNIKTLPPRHSGYRAATSGRYVTTVEGRKLPEPPAGGGGGSNSEPPSGEDSAPMWHPGGITHNTTPSEEVLMLRMVNGEGSIIHIGLLRDGFGFKAVSGHRWIPMQYNDKQILAVIAHEEVSGYTLDYGPVSFPVIGAVVESIRLGRVTRTATVLLNAFHQAGAPNI